MGHVLRGPLRPRFIGVANNLVMRGLDAVTAPFLTEKALAVRIGTATVHLGHPEPDLPSRSVGPTLPETKEVLDPLESMPPVDGTRDWTDLDYRLRVIRHYFAAFQRGDPGAQGDPLVVA